jgi:hypothetical protein
MHGCAEAGRVGEDGGRLGGIEGCAGREQRLQLPTFVPPLQSFLKKYINI